jgi:acetyl-CoA acetyltransferase
VGKHFDRVKVVLMDLGTCTGLRTPFCRAKKGGLRDTSSDELLCGTLTEVRKRLSFDPQLVGDIVVGKVPKYALLVDIFLAVLS